MTDNLEALKAEIAELRKAVQALPVPKGGKDIWEKLGTFSTLFSSVILGAVGLFATQVYNQHQLAQQRQELLWRRRELNARRCWISFGTMLFLSSRVSESLATRCSPISIRQI